MLLYRGTGRYYVEHLVFSLHFYAFDFLMKCVAAILYLTSDYTTQYALPLARGVYYVVVFVYLLLALRRVYEHSLTQTSIKAVVQFIFEIGLFILINILGFVLAVAFYG